MEESPSKLSVAELAGRFKGHVLPMPSSNDQLPFRRRPPSSLKLQHPKQDDKETDKTVVSSSPLKIRMKNSPIIEKLQANLALSPTALLPSPKSPEVKLQPAPASPSTPRSPHSPTLLPSQPSTEDEDPISFDSPPEGGPLRSINKTRARLSFKRRPPTRQHRRSAAEGAEALGSSSPPPCELHSPKENGNQDQGMENPAEEDEYGDTGSLNEAEGKDRDCEKTEDEEVRGDPGHKGDPEREKTSEQAQIVEGVEEEEEGKEEEEEEEASKPCPAEQTESDVQTEEGRNDEE